MDITDFHGLFKYKLFIPALYVVSWIAMVIGPSFFPVIYQRFCICCILYLNIKVFVIIAITVVAAYGSHKAFKIVAQQQNNSDYRSLSGQFQQIYYAFIIPSYKEDIDLLTQTLDKLAIHTRAKQKYMIFLAMEQHEQGSGLKAQQLIRNHQHKFKIMSYTLHQVQKYEQKGKAANVSWCGQRMKPILIQNGISPQKVIITVMDADSWAPNVYYDILQAHLLQNFDLKDTFIYQPPQIFTRNNLDVPVTTRVYDIMHSSMHLSNLYSVFNVTFPLSNYSLSYSLIQKIGFWDTCAQAIGQDFHTTQKAFWKTLAEIKTVPIYTPFNQVNISTGKSYCADVEARFWQAQRHARGIEDVAYCFKMLFNTPFRIRNLILTLQVAEICVLPAIVPWMFISLTYQSKILFVYTKASPEMISQSSLSYCYTLLTIGNAFSYIFYQIIKRRANKILYKQQNQSIFRLFQYAIFFLPNLFLISVPTFTIAAFGSLFGQRQYIVADKVMKKEIQQ